MYRGVESYGGAYDWSPDGAYIVFTGPYPDVPPYQDGFESIWIIGKNGEDPHPFQTNRSVNERRWFFGNFLGWDDSDTLYYSYGAGSGFSHVKGFNLRSGKAIYSEILSSGIYPPHHGFIPNEALGATMIVDTKHFDPNGEQYGEPYIRRPTRNGNQLLALFQGWLPGTNKALILTRATNSEADKNEENLMLWDMDTDQLEEVISNAIVGRFSNDGKTLAFISIKPMNSQQSENTFEAQPGEPSSRSQHYINLFDVKTKTIFFSSRTFSMKDHFPNLNHEYENYFGRYAFLSFPPNDRYFVFLEPASSQRVFLKVFDTALRQVVFSAESSIDKPYPVVWDGIHEWCLISPDSNMLLFTDSNGNLGILYLNTLRTLAITDSGGVRINHSSWSFDSQYLLISYLDSYDTPPIWLTPESVVLRIPKQ